MREKIDNNKKNVLILLGRYLPGQKDGGPIRTISNLVDTFGDDFNFYIACLDRDSGDKKAYENVLFDEWNKVGNCYVYYVKKFDFPIIKELSKDVAFIYICGCYNSYCYLTLILRKIKKINCSFSIAPMGNFSPGALSIKKTKKTTYIKICKLFGLFKNIVWSVTSENELRDTKRIMGENIQYIIAEDLPTHSDVSFTFFNKKPNSVVFLSRISKMKNLIGAISAMSHVKKDVTFDIYGFIEDEFYWEKCKTALQNLPSNISWNYCGLVSFNESMQILSKYQIFLLPTMGENYGHVIFESLSAGCFPIISDTTPWNDIIKENIGAVLPLSEDMDNFTEAIETALEFSDEKRSLIRNRAVNYCRVKSERAKKESGYKKLFN